MYNTLALAMAILLSCAIGVSAQEAPPSEPAHEQFTLADEPRPITFVADLAGRFLGDGSGEDKTGFYPSFGRIVSGAGWISIGPGYRQRVFGDRAVIDGSAAISWRAYKMGQARFEFTDLANSRVALGTQLLWQDLTQLNYFGNGPDSSADGRSEYRLKTTDVAGYGSYRPVTWLTFGASAGRLDGPTLDAPTGPFDRDYPDARLTYPDDPAFSLERQPSFAHGTASVTVETRDYPDHPSSGGLYQIAVTRYSDLDLSLFTFNRFEAEGTQFVPLLYDGLILAFHGWTAISDASARRAPKAGHEVQRHGLARRKTTVRLDAAHGREGWRVSFSLNDPFRLRRLTRRTAAVPFVP